jgi:hypothetical protein
MMRPKIQKKRDVKQIIHVDPKCFSEWKLLSGLGGKLKTMYSRRGFCSNIW